jgi:hypothetical protein
MPQCVLCLRLIGTAIDVYDGGRPKEQLSKNELAQVRKKIKNYFYYYYSIYVFLSGSD